MKEALEKAISARAALVASFGEGTNAYRLFCGEGEGIPGLVIDRCSDVLFFQHHVGKCPAGERAMKSLADWLLERLGAKSVYLKQFIADRSRSLADENMYAGTPFAGELQPDRFEIRENGVRYWLQPYAGFSTGIFLDQRENRRHLAERTGGKEALNLFAYTCAFSAALALRGARVTSVDISKKYLEWGKTNFSLNGLDPAAFRFIPEDAFTYFKRAAKRGQTFDLIVLDPPSFSRGKDGTFSVRKDFPKLLGAALPLVKPGGELFFTTNYTEWTDSYVKKMAEPLLRSRHFKFLPLPPVPEDFRRQATGLSGFLASLT